MLCLLLTIAAAIHYAGLIIACCCGCCALLPRPCRMSVEQYTEKLDGIAAMVNVLGQTDKVSCCWAACVCMQLQHRRTLLLQSDAESAVGMHAFCDAMLLMRSWCRLPALKYHRISLLPQQAPAVVVCCAA